MNDQRDDNGGITPGAPGPHVGVQNQVSDFPDHQAEPAPEHEVPAAKGHPTGFWFFFWGEFAERCSYYGMRAILAAYMADRLGLGEANSATYMSFFIAACYFLPLVGGYVADNFLGKYWTIVGFSVPYVIGQLLVGFESTPFLILSLTLLAMGSGVIKPNISTLMGLTYDQYRPGQTQLRSDAFAIFYFSINIGAAISQFAMPTIRTRYGYQIAFLFPAALMAIALAVFAAGKRFYAVERIERTQLTDEERKERWAVLTRIFGLFVLVMFFWAIFDQSASTWIFFARACMNLHMFGFHVDPDQIQAFNPVFILILLPAVTLFVKYLQKQGMRIRPTDKMVVGFLLTAGCMAIMAGAAVLAGQADLRPYNATGADVAWSIKGDRASYSGRGDVNASVEDAHTVVLKYQVPDPTKPKETYRITSAADLKLVREGDKSLLVTTGDPKGPMSVMLEPQGKEAGPGTTLASEQPLRILLQGDMTLNNRWFVASANQVSIWWQVLAYLVITVAEVLISVTGLELAYTAAPKSMTGFVTACWLLTVGMANLFINASVTRVYLHMQPMAYFGMLAGVLLVVTILFGIVARQFNRMSEARVDLAGVDAGKAPRPGPGAPSQDVTERDRIQD
jgi:POT family proton-dependent oligopeptide transporter